MLRPGHAAEMRTKALQDTPQPCLTPKTRETAPPGWYPTPGERELFTAVRDRFQLVRKRLSNPDVLTTERIDEVIRKASLRLEPNFKKGGKK